MDDGAYLPLTEAAESASVTVDRIIDYAKSGRLSIFARVKGKLMHGRGPDNPPELPEPWRTRVRLALPVSSVGLVSVHDLETLRRDGSATCREFKIPQLAEHELHVIDRRTLTVSSLLVCREAWNRAEADGILDAPENFNEQEGLESRASGQKRKSTARNPLFRYIEEQFMVDDPRMSTANVIEELEAEREAGDQDGSPSESPYVRQPSGRKGAVRYRADSGEVRSMKWHDFEKGISRIRNRLRRSPKATSSSARARQ